MVGQVSECASPGCSELDAQVFAKRAHAGTVLIRLPAEQFQIPRISGFRIMDDRDAFRGISAADSNGLAAAIPSRGSSSDSSSG